MYLRLLRLGNELHDVLKSEIGVVVHVTSGAHEP
jgi:hypothetical protein